MTRALSIARQPTCFSLQIFKGINQKARKPERSQALPYAMHSRPRAKPRGSSPIECEQRTVIPKLRWNALFADTSGSWSHPWGALNRLQDEPGADVSPEDVVKPDGTPLIPAIRENFNCSQENRRFLFPVR
jgi:hypothetical protein